MGAGVSAGRCRPARHRETLEPGRERAREGGPRCLDAAAVFLLTAHQKSALDPFIGQLERAAGFARDDTNATKLDKLVALIGDAAEPGDISLIAEMLSLSGGDRFPPLDLSPQRKKERILAALLQQLQALARRQPV